MFLLTDCSLFFVPIPKAKGPRSTLIIISEIVPYNLKNKTPSSIRREIWKISSYTNLHKNTKIWYKTILFSRLYGNRHGIMKEGTLLSSNIYYTILFWILWWFLLTLGDPKWIYLYTLGWLGQHRNSVQIWKIRISWPIQ